MIRSGELRHLVTIEDRTQTTDNMGGFTESWYTFKKVYASIWPISSRERIYADKKTLDVSHRFKFRYIENLTPDMRITYNGRTFEIVAMENLEERNVAYLLLCKEYV